jgi:hypothetical protein
MLLTAKTTADEGRRRANIDVGVDVGLTIITEDEEVDGEECEENEDNDRDDGHGINAASTAITTWINIYLRH